MKSTRKAVVFAAVLMLSAGTAAAQRPETEASWRTTVYTGVSRGTLDRQDDYEAVPLALRFSTDADRVTRPLGFALPGDWEVAFEPYFSQVIGPDNRQEFGLSLWLRWSTAVLHPRLNWFLEGGVAPMYMTTDTREQGTQFNFLDQLGTGLAYDAPNGLRFETGARVWHISNAGLGDPNSGINGGAVFVGAGRRF